MIDTICHHIQALIKRNYPGFHLIHKTAQDVYAANSFLFTRNYSTLYVTLKLPFSYQQFPFASYSIIMSVPIPIDATSQHGTHLPNLPYYFAMSYDKEHYVTLNKIDLIKCTGMETIYCRNNIALFPITSQSCELGLFVNSKSIVHSKCNFRFMRKSISPKVLVIKPLTILVYQNFLLSFECSSHQRLRPGCDFCVINYPCQFSVTTKDNHLQPCLTTCENFTEKITKVH